mgnify:CR=1 FL=1
MFSAFCLYVSRIFTNIAYYFSLVDEYILNYLKFIICIKINESQKEPILGLFTKVSHPLKH